MTGWRMANSLAPPELISPMLRIHQYVIMCCSTMSQYAGIEALKSGFEDDFAQVRKMVREYDRRRRVLVDGLNAIGLPCFNPEGAFLRLPRHPSTGYSRRGIPQAAAHAEKIAVVPGNAFGESGEGFVRISYAASMQTSRLRLRASTNSFISDRANGRECRGHGTDQTDCHGFDGTFLDDFETPNRKNIEAMRASLPGGVASRCACAPAATGTRRAISSARWTAFNRYCVINNGTAILDTQTEELRYRNRFDPAVSCQILEIALVPRCGRGRVGHVRHTPAQRQGQPAHAADAPAQHRARSAWAGRMIPSRYVGRVGRGLFGRHAARQPRRQLLMRPGNLDEVYQRISGITGIEITTSGHGNMEITPKDGTKAEALSVLADIYEAKPEKRDGLWRQLQRYAHAHVGGHRRGDGQRRCAAQEHCRCGDGYQHQRRGWPRRCSELALHRPWKG